MLLMVNKDGSLLHARWAPSLIWYGKAPAVYIADVRTRNNADLRHGRFLPPNAVSQATHEP